MMDFEDVVGSLDLEPVAVTVLRLSLAEDWDIRHPCSPDRDVAHRVIDEVVDDLREYFGAGVFDDFVTSQVGR